MPSLACVEVVTGERERPRRIDEQPACPAVLHSTGTSSPATARRSCGHQELRLRRRRAVRRDDRPGRAARRPRRGGAGRVLRARAGPRRGRRRAARRGRGGRRGHGDRAVGAASASPAPPRSPRSPASSTRPPPGRRARDCGSATTTTPSSSPWSTAGPGLRCSRTRSTRPCCSRSTPTGRRSAARTRTPSPALLAQAGRPGPLPAREGRPGHQGRPDDRGRRRAGCRSRRSSPPPGRRVARGRARPLRHRHAHRRPDSLSRGSPSAAWRPPVPGPVTLTR